MADWISMWVPDSGISRSRRFWRCRRANALDRWRRFRKPEKESQMGTGFAAFFQASFAFTSLREDLLALRDGKRSVFYSVAIQWPGGSVCCMQASGYPILQNPDAPK